MKKKSTKHGSAAIVKRVTAKSPAPVEFDEVLALIEVAHLHIVATVKPV